MMIVAAAPMVAQIHKFLQRALMYQIVSPPEAQQRCAHERVMPQRPGLTPFVVGHQLLKPCYTSAASLDATAVPLPFRGRRRSSTAEQLFCKQQVTGSIPVAGSNTRGLDAVDLARTRWVRAAYLPRRSRISTNTPRTAVAIASADHTFM